MTLMREQFDRLQKLCVLMEKALSKEGKRRRAHARRQYLKTKNEEERGFISVGIDDSLFEVGRDFPRMLRYALFLSMMSLTESGLVNLCHVAHDRLRLKKPFNSKDSDVIQRALRYLRDEADLNTSTIGYYKQFASDLRDLRNAIAHEEGCIKGRNEEVAIRKFLKGKVGARIDKHDRIVLSERFVVNNAHGMNTMVARLAGKLEAALP